MSDLRIYIDFKSAPAYLAMKPTRAMLDRMQLQVQWLPYDTRQAPVPAEQAKETRGETHVRVRQLERQATCLRYAEVQGIPLTYPGEPGRTRCALAAMLHVQPAPQAFVEAAFLAYWRDHRDLDDPAVVAELLARAGHDASTFDPAGYHEALESNQAEADELGVFDAPMYVIGESLYLGREQLPLIEEVLASSPGESRPASP